MASATASRFQILAAALLFSTGGMAVKACQLGSWQVAGWRSGVAAVVLLAALPGSRRGWSWRTVAVGAAYAATLVLYVLANKTTTAANAIFLQSTAPLYVLLLGPWLLDEPVRPRDLAFFAVLAAGLAAFFLGAQPPTATAPAPRLGNLLGAGAGLTWALTVVGLRALGRGRGRRAGAAAAVVAGNALAFLVCLPLALPVAGSRPVDWLWIAYLGVFQVGLAYLFLTRGLTRVTALEASLLLLLEPVLNPLWAWWMHGETPGPWALAGGGAILLATVAKSWIDSRPTAIRRPAAAGPLP